MAAIVFEQLAKRHGVADRLHIASAGISDYHVGEIADPRTLAVLTEAGYEGGAHRAKQFKPRWLEDFDLVIAFDRGQERALRSLARGDEQLSKIRLLLSFDPDATDFTDPNATPARLLKLLHPRNRLMTDAWLTDAGHKRPMSPGLPLDQARAKAAPLDAQIDALLARLDEVVRRTYAAPEASLVNQRQRQAVAECTDALTAAADALTAGLDEQMVLVDLYRAANALGSLTGAITREDVYTEICSKFCIGK